MNCESVSDWYDELILDWAERFSLMSSDINDDLRIFLIEQLSNEKKSIDGEIYRKIRQDCLKSLATTRWWACLTKNKRQKMKRLLRRNDFTTIFDALLNISSLWWNEMRLNVTKYMIDLKCDEIDHSSYAVEAHWTVKLQKMYHYLDHVRTFWTRLFQHDKRDMRKMNHITMKTLKLKASSTSTFDTMTLFRQLKKREIFDVFDMYHRMKIWTRLHAWNDLILTLWTFFEDFKYIEACANSVKSLITISFRKTLYTIMTRSFFETNQKRGKCIVQEAKSIFTFRSSNSQDRVTLHYREVFLYVMRHVRELSSKFTKLKFKSKKRKIQRTKNFNKFVLYELAELTKRLEFMSAKISNLKAKYFDHADVHLSFKQSKSTFVVDESEENLKRRCACFFDLTYEQSKKFLFLDNIHSTDKSQGSDIQPVFVRRSVYLTYFDRRVFDDQKQDRASRREDVHQAYSSQDQSHVKEMRENRDREQVKINENQDINSVKTDEWQNCVKQLRETSHLFESSFRSQSVQENQKPQLMNDIEESMMYDGEKEWDSVTSSIISSSFYSDEISLEEDSVEKRVPFEKTSLRAITSAFMKATEKNESLQERFKFIFRDEEDWITMKEYFFSSSLFFSMKLTTEKHARKRRYLFDTALWSLHFSKCFEAAMINDTHVILLFSAERICIFQQLVASAS